MRILWQSASPLCNSGYGLQTASVTKQLKQAGYEVAIFCFFGFSGARTNWGDIPLYPNVPHDGYGVMHIENDYKDWNADLLISLVDIWVLKGTPMSLNWAPWIPIDHDPIPPRVLEVLKESPGIIKPIAMSKFGQAELKKQGFDSYYIPHSVDCRIYSPNAELRKTARESLKWEDKFVIGTVATNCKRKNWNASLWAVSQLAKRHSNIVWYMHTPPYDSLGFNLEKARIGFGLKDKTVFPKQQEMRLGIPPEVMARAYNAMDVFLLPSKGEGFGIPALEAQACGCPTIVSNNTAQPEIQAGGWLLKDQFAQWDLQDSFEYNCNPKEILEYLEQAYNLWKNGKMEERQRQARKKALEYDEPKVFEEYWLPTLKDIEERLKKPRNMEGVQPWRLLLLPQVCSPKKVLDIGCGVVQVYRKPLEQLGEYVGIDIKEGEGVTVMDAHHLNFKDKEFGFVWMSEVLEHVDKPEQVLAEAQRVGVHGVCLFSTPENKFFHLDPEHREVKIPHTLTRSGDGLITW